jgi:hypothetical protein
MIRRRKSIRNNNAIATLISKYFSPKEYIGIEYHHCKQNIVCGKMNKDGLMIDENSSVMSTLEWEISVAESKAKFFSRQAFITNVDGRKLSKKYNILMLKKGIEQVEECDYLKGVVNYNSGFIQDNTNSNITLGNELNISGKSIGTLDKDTETANEPPSYDADLNVKQIAKIIGGPSDKDMNPSYHVLWKGYPATWERYSDLVTMANNSESSVDKLIEDYYCNRNDGVTLMNSVHPDHVRNNNKYGKKRKKKSKVCMV